MKAFCTTPFGVVYGNQIVIQTPTQNNIIPNLEKIYVQGGTFIMGDNENTSVFAGKPEHTVTLSNYFISKYEVTIFEFCNFLNEVDNFDIDTHMMSWRGTYKYENSIFYPINVEKNLPVTSLTWQAAYEFCKWAGGRLPTEAEWEYTARGGNKSVGYKYSGSNTIAEVGWTLGSTQSIQQVGLKKPNEIGIYDMSGNVLEMCSDWFDNDYYNVSPILNPQGPESGNKKVVRGGSFNWSPIECTSRYTTSYITSWGSDDQGFRIVFNSN